MARDEIENEIELPDWASTCLVRAINDLHFAVRNIGICGQDEAINQLMRLHASAQSISKSLENNGKAQKLLALAAAFVLCVDLFASAPNVAQVMPVWTSWVGQLSQIEVPLLMSPPKQIEGPKTPEVEEA